MNLPLALAAQPVATAMLAALTVALFLALFRLMRGPSRPDRVIALDLMSMLIIGVIGAYSIATGQTAYLDAAIIIALIGFLSTVGFARYIEKSTLPRAEDRDA
jgi:multicomponent Na+:H+ antiporter subunit F